MDAFIGVTGLVIAAAITPGPNNFIVLERAAHGGFRAAGGPMAGVIAGSVLLLLIVWTGAGALFDAEPRLRAALTLAGCLYLAWLGLGLMRRRPANGAPRPALPSTATGLVVFQLLNPKSWIMVTTATAAVSAQAADLAGLAALAAIFVVVPASCLSIWALVGTALTRFMQDAQRGRWFDRAMGGVLIASAALLLL